MKIRTAKDVEKLDNRIKEEFGIDVQKYRNEEVIENFVNLLVFPQYVFTWVFRPILISIAIFIMGFFIFNLVHIEYIIYGFIGLILFLLTGVLIGLLFLTRKIKSDLWGIVNYSLEVMKSALSDMNQVNNYITTTNRKEVFGVLFKGIIHIVTIPMASKVISDKVPFFAGFLNRILKKVLILISEKVKFQEENLIEELKEKTNEQNEHQMNSSSISSVSTGLEKVINFTFRVVQFPLKLGTGITICILIIFIYLIN